MHACPLMGGLMDDNVDRYRESTACARKEENKSI